MHYRDGREAKIGDFVIGTIYNQFEADGSKKTVVGVLLDITSTTSDVCNCIVGFISTHDIPTFPGGDGPIKRSDGTAFPKTWHDVAPQLKGFYSNWRHTSENGSEAGAFTVLSAETDHSECKALDLVYRPGEPRA